MTSQRYKDSIFQVVPPEWCFKCDVCCRFPEKESYLAPYFTYDEITVASRAGTELNSVPTWFTASEVDDKPMGGRIRLAPFDDAYICPEFDPASAHCKIYQDRPLDCVIYPFAIMWSDDGSEVMLGVDTKCPYVAELMNSDILVKALTAMRNTLDTPPVFDIICENPALVGPCQDDVVHSIVLTNLSQSLAHSATVSRKRY